MKNQKMRTTATHETTTRDKLPSNNKRKNARQENKIDSNQKCTTKTKEEQQTESARSGPRLGPLGEPSNTLDLVRFRASDGCPASTVSLCFLFFRLLLHPVEKGVVA